ncbi:threalose-6-phosphate phosphatase [Blyttiomyces sp. JEL0837]|nr:threalose-6-phosphate phosphatase [Blyttiomyces sp. JEL0837]
MSKLIVVTHHLPVTCVLSSSTTESISATATQWRLAQRRGHSALFSGIKSLKEDENVLHIGWVGHCMDDDGKTIDFGTAPMSVRKSLHNAMSGQKLVPVFLDEQVAYGHYEGYLTDGTSESRHWQDYVAMNTEFAQTILDAYNPGDSIWIHDYHLLLLPSILRKLLPKAEIGFFLHTPFPSSEIFRCLPKRKEILQGVLGANLIGFQTYSYARHFISSCTRVLGLESSPKGVEYKGSLISVGIFPIGIDVNRVEERRRAVAVQEKINAIRELYAGKKIIIGRDKLDHIKGVQHKLNAFEKFLTLYPEWQNKVVLIQVTSPPQRENPKLESKVSELVSRINGNFGSLEFVPVHHYHQHLDQDEYFALLSVAHVGLITSVRDGMNTTSHEFVVCQQENHGPLILSEFTGTAGSLGAAMLVNPWDYLGVAHAINEALVMSNEEKTLKYMQLYNHVTLRTVEFWAKSFVKELRECLRTPDQSNPTPFLDYNVITEKYKHAKKRLLMFDYDGTLTPIRKTPGAAVPSPEMLRYLSILTKDPKNYVFVISGRDQACLDDWLGHIEGLGLSAEHGCFIKYPDLNEGKWNNLSEQIDLSWKSKVVEIFNYYTERTQGSFVEHKRCSITWHYRLADPDYGSFQAKECQNHLENAILSKLPVEVMIGKKNLEVRPVSINKGEIVKRLLASRVGTDFVYCVGDDKTDEDMFKSLRRSDLPEENCFTCTIGSANKFTKASWHLSSPEQALIAAKYNGIEVETADVEMGVTNKTPEFLKKFPLGKVPAFENGSGFTLYESNAIAYYVASYKADSKLLGANKEEAARIQQFIALADNELVPAQATWIFPLLGWIPNYEQNTKKAIEDTKKVLNALDQHLLHHTFLVGEVVTLADISVVTALLNFYRLVFEPTFRAPYKNVNRWFTTCINQPFFKEVLGEVALCEVAKVAEPPKAREASAPKVEKKEAPKKEAAPAPAKEAKKPKKKDDDDEEEEESYEDKPKEKNPLDLLPKSTFVLDEWKRFYSNNDTRPTAVNWFWEHYDPEGYSLVRVDYKYNSELAMTFMSSNLIGGFFQRLDNARKYAFGSLVVLGEDNNNSIAGYFVCRGSGVPNVIEECADYESWNFVKVDHKDPKHRELFAAYIAWDDVIEGKKFADGKVFK